MQKIENAKLLAGKTVTLSALVKSATNSWRLQLYNGSNASHCPMTDAGLFSLKWEIPEESTKLFIRLQSTEVASEIEIVAIKLELGDTQTLAHQDANGNWVLNEVPDYGEQLARCQRYQIRLSDPLTYAIRVGIGFMESETTAQIIVPIPVTMRTGPAVVFENLAIHDGSKTYAVTNVGCDHANNVVRMNATITGGTAGRLCTLIVLGGGYCILDANL